MAFLTVLVAATSLFGSATVSHTTDTFAVLNCTNREMQLNTVYTPLIGSRIIDIHGASFAPMSMMLETSSDKRDAESMLVSFIPVENVFPIVKNIPLRPLSNGLDVRFAYVGLLVDETGALVWKRLRNNDLTGLEADFSSTAAICATLFYNGYGM